MLLCQGLAVGCNQKALMKYFENKSGPKMKDPAVTNLPLSNNNY